MSLCMAEQDWSKQGLKLCHYIRKHTEAARHICFLIFLSVAVCPQPGGQSAYRRLKGKEKCSHFQQTHKDGAQLVLCPPRFCFVTAVSLRTLPHFCPTSNQKAGAEKHARMHTYASMYLSDISVTVDNACNIFLTCIDLQDIVSASSWRDRPDTAG